VRVTTGDIALEPILVYHASSTGPPVGVSQRLLTVARAKADGSRDVLELVELLNAGPATRVAADTLQPTWRACCRPAWCNFRRAGRRVAGGRGGRGDTVLVFFALAARAGRQVSFGYTLPASVTRFVVHAATITGTSRPDRSALRRVGSSRRCPPNLVQRVSRETSSFHFVTRGAARRAVTTAVVSPRSRNSRSPTNCGSGTTKRVTDAGTCTRTTPAGPARAARAKTRAPYRRAAPRPPATRRPAPPEIAHAGRQHAAPRGLQRVGRDARGGPGIEQLDELEHIARAVGLGPRHREQALRHADGRTGRARVIDENRLEGDVARRDAHGLGEVGDMS